MMAKITTELTIFCKKPITESGYMVSIQPKLYNADAMVMTANGLFLTRALPIIAPINPETSATAKNPFDIT